MVVFSLLAVASLLFGVVVFVWWSDCTSMCSSVADSDGMRELCSLAHDADGRSDVR